MDGAGLVQQVADELERSGIDLTAMGLGWARVAPAVAIVPVFGLRAVPGPVRAVFGLVLAASIAPAIHVDPLPGNHGWIAQLVVSFIQGLPIALATAVPLWAATMAGGVIDAVRGSSETLSMPPAEGRSTVLGVPMALLAGAVFLSGGGPARVLEALARSTQPSSSMLLKTSIDIASGVEIALAVAAPVLAASVVIEIGAGLIARGSAPAQVHALLAPLRSLGILAVTALMLDRVVGAVAIAIAARP